MALAILAGTVALTLLVPALLAELQLRGPAADPMVVLSVGRDRPTVSLPLERYVVGVVAAEMPARFALPALEAQAVAARSYTIYQRVATGGSGCADDRRADVCVGPAKGQAWLDAAGMRRAWGSNYAANLARVSGAVAATRGLVLTFHGRVADALYSAASGGETEAARYVWGKAVSYLVARPVPFEGPTPYDVVTSTFGREEFARRLGIAVDAVRPGVLAIVRRDPSGRVLLARVGGRMLRGAEVRQRLNLPSTWIVASRIVGNRLLVTTRGYGHGVGMSQWGAEGMAQEGADFRAILAYFYPGTELARLHSLTIPGKAIW